MTKKNVKAVLIKIVPTTAKGIVDNFFTNLRGKFRFRSMQVESTSFYSRILKPTIIQLILAKESSYIISFFSLSQGR